MLRGDWERDPLLPRAFSLLSVDRRRHRRGAGQDRGAGHGAAGAGRRRRTRSRCWGRSAPASRARLRSMSTCWWPVGSGCPRCSCRAPGPPRPAWSAAARCSTAGAAPRPGAAVRDEGAGAGPAPDHRGRLGRAQGAGDGGAGGAPGAPPRRHRCGSWAAVPTPCYGRSAASRAIGAFPASSRWKNRWRAASASASGARSRRARGRSATSAATGRCSTPPTSSMSARATPPADACLPGIA